MNQKPLHFEAVLGSLDFGAVFLENELLNPTSNGNYQLYMIINFKKITELNASKSFKATKLTFSHTLFTIEVYGSHNWWC